MKPNRREACLKAMERALTEPVAIAFDSPRLAKAWRFTCYGTRAALRASGDTRFDSLSFKLHDTTLEISHADSQNQTHSRMD